MVEYVFNVQRFADDINNQLWLLDPDILSFIHCLPPFTDWYLDAPHQELSFLSDTAIFNPPDPNQITEDYSPFIGSTIGSSIFLIESKDDDDILFKFRHSSISTTPSTRISTLSDNGSHLQNSPYFNNIQFTQSAKIKSPSSGAVLCQPSKRRYSRLHFCYSSNSTKRETGHSFPENTISRQYFL